MAGQETQPRDTEGYQPRRRKSYGYKVELTGYHIDASEIDVYPGFYGTVALPNPANPNFPDVVTIGTSSNPIQKGKVFISDILDDVDVQNMPYTAKIEVEIPIGSGNKYLKNGVDGKRTIQGRSSMFPKSWDLDKIIEEVAYVRSRLVGSDEVFGSRNLYSKACSDGSFNIRMYLNNPADLNNYDVIGGSAFPEVR